MLKINHNNYRTGDVQETHYHRQAHSNNTSKHCSVEESEEKITIDIDYEYKNRWEKSGSLRYYRHSYLLAEISTPVSEENYSKLEEFFKKPQYSSCDVKRFIDSLEGVDIIYKKYKSD